MELRRGTAECSGRRRRRRTSGRRGGAVWTRQAAAQGANDAQVAARGGCERGALHAAGGCLL